MSRSRRHLEEHPGTCSKEKGPRGEETERKTWCENRWIILLLSSEDQQASKSSDKDIMERRPIHRGVMTQAVLAVKQWHMAQLHNIKQFGGSASLLPKQHSDLANWLCKDYAEELRARGHESWAFLMTNWRRNAQRDGIKLDWIYKWLGIFKVSDSILINVIT